MDKSQKLSDLFGRLCEKNLSHSHTIFGWVDFRSYSYSHHQWSQKSSPSDQHADAGRSDEHAY